MRPVRNLALAALAVAALVSAPAARADVPPPDTEACNGRTLGDTCTVPGGPSGTCQNSTCQRLDYANWNRDASSMPPTMNYACVRCLPAGASGDAGTTTPPPSTRACSVSPGRDAVQTSFAWLGAFALAGLWRARRRAST